MMLNGLEQVLKLIVTHERRREDIKSKLTCNKDKNVTILNQTYLYAFQIALHVYSTIHNFYRINLILPLTLFYLRFKSIV